MGSLTSWLASEQDLSVGTPVQTQPQPQPQGIGWPGQPGQRPPRTQTGFAPQLICCGDKVFAWLQICSVQMPRQFVKVKDNLADIEAQMEAAWLNVTKQGTRGSNRHGEEASPSLLPAAPGLPQPGAAGQAWGAGDGPHPSHSPVRGEFGAASFLVIWVFSHF